MAIQGMGKFLNKATLSANKQSLKIENIDINKIYVNDNNFYGLRDIDELAAMIATSNYVEPLEVVVDGDGYRLIAGHRRRAAVLQLIEKGARESTEVPCIIRTFNNENSLDLDVNEIEIINLIFSNRGQRQNITPKEKLEEIRRLEPIARKIYNSEEFKAENGGKRGPFKIFFAKSILDISDGELGRLKSLERLSPKAMKALEDGLINKSVAVHLSSLAHEDQDAYIDNEDSYSLNSVEEFKSSLGSDEPFESHSEDADFEVDVDDDISKPEDDSFDDDSDDTTEDEPVNEPSPSSSSDEIAPEAEATASVDEKLVQASKEATEIEREATNWIISELSSLNDKLDEQIQHEKDVNNNVEASKWNCYKARLNHVISLLSEG